MASKLCMNCFASYRPEVDGSLCPKCAWDNSKPQTPEGLELQTVLAGRYVVGRVRSMNSEGITYMALDRTTQRTVTVREFYPRPLSSRGTGQGIAPRKEDQGVFDKYADEFLELSKGVSRLRELSVIESVLDIFEENGTVYTVYRYTPTVSLRSYVEKNGRLGWNEVNQMFMPVLTALGLVNSLGIAHLGVSPDTLRVTKDGTLLLTGFCIHAARRMGSPIAADLDKGCAAVEQYSSKAVCGEGSDVYALAASMLFALTGRTPKEAPGRMEDPRLLIAKDVMKSLPPFAVTAIANALQVKQGQRTGSFERFRSELSAAPALVEEIDQTDAIRRLPPINMSLPQNRGLPPVVWLIGSCVVTLITLVIVASAWLGDRGMSFGDLGQLFQGPGVAQSMVEVPNMLNQSYEEWEKKIADGEFEIQLKISSRSFSSTIEEGNIISQAPFAGENVQPGSTIVVTVSKGAAVRVLPEVRGVSFADLQEMLTSNGFVPVRQEEHNDDIGAGYVIRYDGHEVGDSLDYGSEVTVVVSAGPEEAPVTPDTTGGNPDAGDPNAAP